MGTESNLIHERGMGNWEITVYAPSKTIGPFRGLLQTAKDFHCIFEVNGTQRKCIASIPSQNVAYVVDVDATNRI